MYEQLVPTEAQLEKLLSLPPDSPVAALNLFQFRDRARYSEEDPEFGTEAANVSGQEAFARYSAAAGEFLSSLGGSVVFSAVVDQLMIGPDEQQWDVAAVMYFPTRKAFIDMLMAPDFQATSRHRKAALTRHHMLHLGGTPFA